MREKHYSRGKPIVKQGEPSSGLFLVLRGKVKVNRVSPAGREQTIHILGGGEVLAGVPLLDGGPIPGTAFAMEEVTIGVIPRPDLFTMLENHPKICLKFLLALSHRIRELQDRVTDLGLKDAPARFASLLLTMARNNGSPCGTGLRLDIPLTHQDIANLIGTSRETISRLISDFRVKGLIETDKDGIILLDQPSLAELGQ